MCSKPNPDLCVAGAAARDGGPGHRAAAGAAAADVVAGAQAAAAPVLMGMTAEQAERLSGKLVAIQGSQSADQLRELLWLRAVFLEQRRRTPSAERLRFERRADRILGQLWRSNGELLPSGATNTLGRSEKR